MAHVVRNRARSRNRGALIQHLHSKGQAMQQDESIPSCLGYCSPLAEQVLDHAQRKVEAKLKPVIWSEDLVSLCSL